jgi:hypothetical protein
VAGDPRGEKTGAQPVCLDLCEPLGVGGEILPPIPDNNCQLLPHAPRIAACPQEPAMPNRLAQESSPYLLQHADNPVDWQPWGEAALEQARREDRPILLSIGYSACHWCHVMAHECFEDPEVAAVMNRLFVNIKVDREERPDLDQIYQTAHQMLARRGGGWPLTLFLAPDQTPFFAGTYFPKQARFGLPGFVQLMEYVADAYRHRRADIEAQNAALLEALADQAAEAGPAVAMAEHPLRAAVAQLTENFDPVHAGYGGAPKFPRPADLEFLLQRGDARSREQVLVTLRRMAERGLMDQLGGGFYRYSVDERWAIPHFEKMLYDNGPLLALYADAWALTGEAGFLRAAALTVDWLAREMTTPEGVFCSALDADSEHEEGRFYVWTPEAARALLSAEEYAVAAPRWGLDAAPNFEGHAWHLGGERSLEAVAAELGLDMATATDRLESARVKLLAAREQRVRPGRDDKVLASWNALMIRGLARAGRRCDRPDWTRMAQGAVDALRRLAWRDGRLLASWKDGQARHNGYLDDYAFLLDALLECLQADYRTADLAWARELADALLTHFEDPERGGFWFTSHDHERLIHRMKPVHDNAMPAGNGVAAVALNRLGQLIGEPRYLQAAERALRLFYPAMADHPPAFPGLLGPATELGDWQSRAQRALPANALCLAIPPDTPGLPDALAKPVRTYVAAHVCTGVKCLPEIVRFDDLAAIFML